MKIQIKNITDNPISLFVRKDGVDEKVTILGGNSIVADDFETKTIRIFKKRNFITTKEAQLFESDSSSLLSEEVVKQESDNNTIDTTIDSNNDETMDKFHTTRTHEVENVDKSSEASEKPSGPFKIDLDPEDPTSFEVVESEVKQYVEGGYIKGAWSDEDEEFLKKHYPTKGRKYCANNLNRNESSVQKKINALGLKKKKKKKKK